MNTVYLVTANCGDYYCGCGTGHVIGASFNRSMADDMLGRAVSEWGSLEIVGVALDDWHPGVLKVSPSGTKYYIDRCEW